MTRSPKEIIDEYTKKVFLRIEQVKNAKGFTDIALIDGLKTLGISANRNTVNDWRKGKSSSFLDCIGQIAEVLETEFDELTDLSLLPSENNLNTKPSALASQLLEFFDQCDEKGQIRIIALTMQELARTEEERKKSESRTSSKEVG